MASEDTEVSPPFVAHPGASTRYAYDKQFIDSVFNRFNYDGDGGVPVKPPHQQGSHRHRQKRAAAPAVSTHRSKLGDVGPSLQSMTSTPGQSGMHRQRSAVGPEGTTCSRPKMGCTAAIARLENAERKRLWRPLGRSTLSKTQRAQAT